MINYIQIHDFQSLADVELSLGRFTLVLGQSDLGKSAIIRAINALATNALGSSFIRYGKDATSVFVSFDDYQSVSWNKGKSASYTTDHPVLGHLVFQRVGRSVPPEVADIIRFGQDEFDPTLHRQFDPPFLVTESGATRAKILGDLSGLNLIAQAIAETRRLSLQTNRQRQERQEARERHQAALKAFTYLRHDQTVLAATQGHLEALRKQAARAQEARRLASALTTADQTAAGLIKLGRQQAAIYKAFITVDFSGLDRSAALRKLAETIDVFAAQVDALAESASRLEADLAVLESTLAAVPVCQTCGQPIILEHIDAISAD